MPPDDLETALERVASRLDFGEYESRAYPVVLRHGEITASKLADRADIPQPRVYDTVRALADRGLVEVQETRPMRVLAVDPREGFDTIQDEMDALLGALEEAYTAPIRTPEAVALVTSRSSILRYLEDVIGAAEYELVVSLTPGLLDRFADDLGVRLEDDVTVELLLSPATDVPSPEEVEYGSFATVVRERRGITTPVMAVADGTYSVYANREALTPDQDRYGVVFNRSELGFLASGFLNTVLWSSAEPVFRIDRELRFPRRYATIRRCVADLQRREGPFYATVRGRDVETGQVRQVQGRVTSIAFDESGGTATLTIDADSGPISIGGQVAAIEDIEAAEIRIATEDPPPL